VNLPWVGLLVVVALLTAIGHVMFKLAAVGDRKLRDRLTDLRFIAGCAAFGLAPVLTFLAAQHLEFSTIYAITALNFPFVMIMAAFVLREPIDRFKVLGVTGIMVGLGIFLWL